MVREHMPLQASQKRISWSYEPVTRITDISLGVVATDFDDDDDGGGITVREDMGVCGESAWERNTRKLGWFPL